MKNLTPDPLKVQIHTLKGIALEEIDSHITIYRAAELLMDKNLTCVVLDHKIITPWDIVNKMLISQVAY